MRWFKRIVLWIVVIATAWLLVVWTGVLPRISDEQRTAVALLHEVKAPGPPEQNAYAGLWLLRYEVPADQQQRILAEDVARFTALPHVASEQTTPFVSGAAGHFPEITIPADPDSRLCIAWEPGCLAKVRAAHDAVKSLVESAVPALQRQEQIYPAQFLWDPFPARLDTPIPQLGTALSVRLPMSAAALRFIDGDQLGGLTATCRYADFWRRMRAHTNSLIVDMVAVAYVSTAASLYGEMLAEIPADVPLPEECQRAFAVLAEAEVDQCAVYQHEFAMIEGSIRAIRPQDLNDLGSGLGLEVLNRVQLLGLQPEHTVALSAPAFAAHCGAAAKTANSERDPDYPRPGSATCGAIEEVFNPVGCMLWRIGSTSLRDYRLRMLDLDARLRLVASVNWLRAQVGEAQRSFDERRSELRERHHPMEFVADRRMLRVKNLDPRKGEWWEIPLAGSRAPATTARKPGKT